MVGLILIKGKGNLLQVLEPPAVHRIENYVLLEEYQAAYQLMADKVNAAATDMLRDLTGRYPQTTNWPRHTFGGSMKVL